MIDLKMSLSFEFGKMLQSALFQNESDDKITIFDIAWTTDLKQVIGVGEIVEDEDLEVEKAMIWRWEVSGQ